MKKVLVMDNVLKGDCSGLRGNLDECELTEEDRQRGVDIRDLVKLGDKDGKL